MKILLKAIIIVFLIQGCASVKKSVNKSIDSAKKVILKIEGQEEFFYWEVNDQPNIWNYDLGNINELNGFIDSMKLALGEERYNKAVRNESIQNLDKSLLAKEENGDRINALLVHTGTLGKIRKINYLESQILNYQIGKVAMFTKPTEFHAFIVKHKKKGKIRVYFGSSDTPWPPRPQVLIKELEKEIQNGWYLIRHLHNHNCGADKDYVGILAPSLADAQYYKMLKERFNIDKALITNGIHTVEIDNKDFIKFESH